MTLEHVKDRREKKENKKVGHGDVKEVTDRRKRTSEQREK